jgi:hypothetical protein
MRRIVEMLPISLLRSLVKDLAYSVDVVANGRSFLLLLDEQVNRAGIILFAALLPLLWQNERFLLFFD